MADPVDPVDRCSCCTELLAALMPLATIGEGIERIFHPAAVVAWRANTAPCETEEILAALHDCNVTPLVLVRYFLEALDVAAKYGPVPVARCHRVFRSDGKRCVLRVQHEGRCQTEISERGDDEIAIDRHYSKCDHPIDGTISNRSEKCSSCGEMWTPPLTWTVPPSHMSDDLKGTQS